MKKQKRIYGADLKSRRVTLDDTDWYLLKSVGNGNASEGLRRMIKERREGK